MTNPDTSGRTRQEPERASAGRPVLGKGFRLNGGERTTLHQPFWFVGMRGAGRADYEYILVRFGPRLLSFVVSGRARREELLAPASLAPRCRDPEV